RPWFRFWPAGVPKGLSYPPGGLCGLLERRATETPKAVALIDGAAQVSFGELWAAAQAVQAQLADMDVPPGSRVLLVLPNSASYPAAYFGILRAGCVAVPINTLAPLAEVEEIVGDTEPAAGIISVERSPHLREFLVAGVRHILSAEPQSASMAFSLASAGGRAGRVRSRTDNRARDPQESGGTDAAVIQQTGGTTGTRKGAVMSHTNLIANAVQNATWFDWSTDDVVMGLLPFCHTWGLSICVHSVIFSGARVAVMDRYEVEKALQLVEDNRVTVWYGPASLFIALLNHPALTKANLSSLRYVKAGAMPIPEGLPRRWEDATGVRFVTGYGLTEASPETHNSPRNHVRPGSIGIPLPDTDARIADPEQPEVELPPGKTGELLVKGPQVMKEYWKRPEETAAAFSNGWLRTGDIARMDDDGFFYIVDRKKDLIKYKGHSIFPCDLENIVYRHEFVRECAVIGRPDQQVGEIPKAFVVLKEGCKPDAAAILDHCAKHAAPQKRLREVEFVREIPKNRVGKVLRRKLRARESPLARLILQSERIVAFTGAGVSAESGIPTYRGEGGLWTKYDPDKFASIDYFNTDPTYFWSFFKEIRIPLLKGAKPGPTHLALAALEKVSPLPLGEGTGMRDAFPLSHWERAGVRDEQTPHARSTHPHPSPLPEGEGRKLLAVITQNIDGLHQLAGSTRVLELHGNTRTIRCTGCPARHRMEEVDSLLETQMPPLCPKCKSVLRPDVVFFGESLPEDVLAEAFSVAGHCDLMLALGSSLLVYPAAAIPITAKERGARLVIINKSGTPYDAFADLAIDGPAGAHLEAAVDAAMA
ncbi:MAG: AMP-binding protein, partial [Planctomycetota bacterium]|nr:AMP-binding protein [Planctomycetota bacterium]